MVLFVLSRLIEGDPACGVEHHQFSVMDEEEEEKEKERKKEEVEDEHPLASLVDMLWKVAFVVWTFTTKMVDFLSFLVFLSTSNETLKMLKH